MVFEGRGEMVDGILKNFFGDGSGADARRWTNPDGSQGGVVAVSASVAAGLTLLQSTLVYPYAKIAAADAIIGPEVRIGADAIIGGSVVISAGATIGATAIIGDAAQIGHGAIIGAGSVVRAGAIIGAEATIGTGSIIGEKAAIGCGAIIGDRAWIGGRAILPDGIYIGQYAQYAERDWGFVAGGLAQRSQMVTAIWSLKRDLRWWIDVYCGLTSEELKVEIERRYRGDPQAEDYLYLIQVVERHPGLAKAIAKAEGRS